MPLPVPATAVRVATSSEAEPLLNEIAAAVLLAVPRAEWYGPLARGIDGLLQFVASGQAVGPVFAVGIGALLGVSPVALPTIPAVVTVLAPPQAGDASAPPTLSFWRAVPVVTAFVLGMDGVVALVGYALVEVTIMLVRASVVLHLLAATVLGIGGIRLVTRRTSLCRRARAIPPKPLDAFGYGIGFAVGGCPGCAPVSLGVGFAAASFGSPLYVLAVIGGFVAGHTVVLLAAAAAGARWVRGADAESPRWARLDRVVGALFLVAAAYYLFRVLSGTATTILPGESGGLLP